MALSAAHKRAISEALKRRNRLKPRKKKAVARKPRVQKPKANIPPGAKAASKSNAVTKIKAAKPRARRASDREWEVEYAKRLKQVKETKDPKLRAARQKNLVTAKKMVDSRRAAAAAKAAARKTGKSKGKTLEQQFPGLKAKYNRPLKPGEARAEDGSIVKKASFYAKKKPVTRKRVRRR